MRPLLALAFAVLFAVAVMVAVGGLAPWGEPERVYPSDVWAPRDVSRAVRVDRSARAVPDQADPDAPAVPVPVAPAEPAPLPEPPPPPPPPPPMAPSDDIWWALAGCESTHTNANTGNGYYGYFQFLPSTWTSVGGPGMPHEHSYETQRHYAIILQQRSGWGQWPACTRRLGLR